MGAGASYGLLGALAAFPRRLARREVECQGGVLRRGLTRRTTHAVFGRRLLERLPDEAIAAHFDAAVAAGAVPLSENGFRRALGLLPGAAAGSLSRQALLDQSGLAPRSFDLLALFDAFEHDAEPFSFRDAVLAKSYARLAAAGAGWGAIARSAHRAGKVTSLTALALHAGEDDAIYRRHGEALTEIDGQHLLPLAADDDDADELFEAAEAAEAAGEPARAAALYARYLGREPTDAVAAFNRANALRAAGDVAGARHAYALALKLDPGFVEAWFNFGSLLHAEGRLAAARAHLLEAVALDPGYGDPIYNLAVLAYAAGDLAEARAWWARYVALDPDSEWGRRAARGISYVDGKLAEAQRAGDPGRVA